MPQYPVKTSLLVTKIIAGAGVVVTPSVGTGEVTVAVGGAESPTAITGGATPFPISGQAAATATSPGGEVDLTGAAGGATSGAGGAAKVTGGAGTAGNAAGGEADLTGGAGQGSAAGGAAKVTGGVGGATGTGGAVSVTGGAAGSGSNANGADVNIAGGAKDGTGVAGVVRIGGVKFVQQGNQSTQDTAATLTAAQLLAGILTSNPSGVVNLQLPAATAMDTALPSSVAGDAFDFSVISLAGSTNLPTITTNTGWTLVGAMVFTAVAGNPGLFRARKTGTGAWTLYRIG